MASNELTPARQQTFGRAATPRLSPFAPFNLLQSEIDRVFDSFSNFRNFDIAFRPSMEVAETDESIEISTELPGMDETDVDISIADDILTISGEKKGKKEEKNKSYRLVERTYGSFERSVALPPGINADAVKASMNKGVLKITLPKPAATQTQRVEISNGER